MTIIADRLHQLANELLAAAAAYEKVEAERDEEKRLKLLAYDVIERNSLELTFAESQQLNLGENE